MTIVILVACMMGCFSVLLVFACYAYFKVMNNLNKVNKADN